ncbi:hypothetical protein MF406_01855 [Georgenia sp. TF02-10]|uniref:hypothetical protein n=1 Tax=Georgenia sp. TF02-10 TaxID=2917725 RepID=UPI001FA7938D|nr:hypothetical protein [Georgenia sp. TF02-10]UNX55055.1 hypothetical protein MF406_01855 [Georgenia sp. TF02-10]
MRTRSSRPRGRRARLPRLAPVALAGGAAAAVAWWRQRRPNRDAVGAHGGGLVLTVDRPAAELDPLPAPLADLGDRVDVELRPAPGGRGTELAATPRPGASGVDRDTLRTALREAKQIAETGEVLRLGDPPHGRRSRTPAGAVLDAVGARAREKGML